MPNRVYTDAEWSLAGTIAAKIMREYRLHVDVTCLTAYIAKVIVEAAEAAGGRNELEEASDSPGAVGKER